MSESSLKQKTIGALLWNLLDRMGQQVLLFIVGILVANITLRQRLCAGRDACHFQRNSQYHTRQRIQCRTHSEERATCRRLQFRLLVRSGNEYPAVWSADALSPLIARFFNQPKLVELSAVIFLALPINALTIIQSTILNKQIRFKPLTQINLYSMTVSGIASLCHGTDRLWSMDIGPATGNTGSSARHPAMEPRELASATDFPLRSHTVTVRIRFKPVIGKPYQYLLPEYLFRYHRQTVSAKTIGILYARKQNVRYGCQPDLRKYKNATFPIFSTIQNERERLIRAYRKTIRLRHSSHSPSWQVCSLQQVPLSVCC